MNVIKRINMMLYMEYIIPEPHKKMAIIIYIQYIIPEPHAKYNFYHIQGV